LRPEVIQGSPNRKDIKMARMQNHEEIERSLQKVGAEDRVKGTEEKCRAILENIEDGYYEVDLAGNFTFINDAFCRILKYTRDELIGMNDREYTDKENAKKVYKVFNRVYTTGKPAKLVDWEIICKDGTKRYAEVSATLIQNSYRHPVGFRGICRDITERKLAQREMRRKEKKVKAQAKKLEEVNAALKILLKQRENDRTELEEKILSNVKVLTLPYIDKLKKAGLDGFALSYINIIEGNINNIISPFLYKLSSKYMNLTPKEIQIANLVKEGKSNKEIAELSCISLETVKAHRQNIRKKLGLKNKKENLVSYLLSIP
jgi:PAS domain S-box-containing protein